MGWKASSPASERRPYHMECTRSVSPDTILRLKMTIPDSRPKTLFATFGIRYSHQSNITCELEC